MKQARQSPLKLVIKRKEQTGLHSPGLWGSIPKDPEKFAMLVSRLVTTNRLTPKEEECLEILWPFSSGHCHCFSERAWKQINKTVNQLKTNQTDKGRERHYAIVSAMLVKNKYRALSRELGLRPNYVCNVARRSAMHVTLSKLPHSVALESPCYNTVTFG